MTKDFKEVEPKACDDCGRSMDFDDIEEAYFLFLKPLKKAN
jgi:hypothetical protein